MSTPGNNERFIFFLCVGKGQARENMFYISPFKICIFFIEMKSMKFVVTADGGIQSSSESQINSKKVKMYAKNTILTIIQIQNSVSEQKLRGQIQTSLDWVSIKDTKNQLIWMKPILEVTKT